MPETRPPFVSAFIVGNQQNTHANLHIYGSWCGGGGGEKRPNMNMLWEKVRRQLGATRFDYSIQLLLLLLLLLVVVLLWADFRCSSAEKTATHGDIDYDSDDIPLSPSTDEFRSKVACENDVIQLVCNPYSRIAVYSASYGRTEYESIQCAQPLGVKEESEYTTQYLWLCDGECIHVVVMTGCRVGFV